MENLYMAKNKEARYNTMVKLTKENLIFWKESLDFWLDMLGTGIKNGYDYKDAIEGIKRAKEEIIDNENKLKCRNYDEYSDYLCYGKVVA